MAASIRTAEPAPSATMIASFAGRSGVSATNTASPTKISMMPPTGEIADIERATPIGRSPTFSTRMLTGPAVGVMPQSCATP
jgi:hypothetical protein